MASSKPFPNGPVASWVTVGCVVPGVKQLFCVILRGSIGIRWEGGPGGPCIRERGGACVRVCICVRVCMCVCVQRTYNFCCSVRNTAGLLFPARTALRPVCVRASAPHCEGSTDLPHPARTTLQLLCDTPHPVSLLLTRAERGAADLSRATCHRGMGHHGNHTARGDGSGLEPAASTRG